MNDREFAILMEAAAAYARKKAMLAMGLGGTPYPDPNTLALQLNANEHPSDFHAMLWYNLSSPFNYGPNSNLVAVMPQIAKNVNLLRLTASQKAEFLQVVQK